ncbi:hypothetical protein [Hydrogenophaga sp.]|uniref:hypothetical protein n=1 Tax=Hydrogenophaga sp. TaxID=1904254 RepID=UPI0025C61A00|nr:hypothetical protein [Hydrogenophaga sp.]MBT9464486.1 hypothetical protein [Hydrogenophaga sp.]
MKQPSLILARTALVAASALSTAGAWAQTTYEQDRAACMRSDSQHERTSCLREAAAVRDQSKKRTPRLGDTPESRMQNAMRRCTELPPENKATCERMVRGEGTVSGSVESGGVIRELVTPVPAIPPMQPMPPAQPMPPPEPMPPMQPMAPPQPMQPMQPMPGAPVVR